MTPDRTLLTIRPDGQKLPQPLEIDPGHPKAITFCLLEATEGAEPVVVISHWLPHKSVYNGLKACDPAGTPTQWKLELEEYQAQVVSGELTREVLERFQQVYRENHGFPRYAVTSGRLWRHLELEGQAVFSVMAFWNHGLDQPDGPALKVVKALKVAGPVYLVSSEKTQGAWHDLAQAKEAEA
jgi:hypothetical protein